MSDCHDRFVSYEICEGLDDFVLQSEECNFSMSLKIAFYLQDSV